MTCSSSTLCLLREGGDVIRPLSPSTVALINLCCSPSPHPAALADVTSRPQTDPAPPHQLAMDALPSSGVAAGMGRECSDMSSLKVTQ